MKLSIAFLSSLVFIYLFSTQLVFCNNDNYSLDKNLEPLNASNNIIMVFPPNNVWNNRIDSLPLHPNSDTYIQTIGSSTTLHPDFGTEWNGAPNGIPFVIVDNNQTLVPISFTWPDESDVGPYPIPSNPPIEGLPHWTSDRGGDRHIIVINQDSGFLYETWNTWPDPDNTKWSAGAGAIFDLNKNKLRPETWTSADAAGLPIYPGLVIYDEVQSGEISHAIRFTVKQTRKAYIWPARHYASSLTGSQYPPMGQRFRLKSSFDTSGFSAQIKVILKAFKRYGIILADNGSNWFISGAPDSRWDDDILRELKNLKGSDFEAVDISSWLNHPDFDPNSATVPGYQSARDPDPDQTNILPIKKEKLIGKYRKNYMPENSLDGDLNTYFKSSKKKKGKIKIVLTQNQTIQQIRFYVNRLKDRSLKLRWKIYIKTADQTSWTLLDKNTQFINSSQWFSSWKNLNIQVHKIKIIFLNKKVNGKRGSFGISEIEGYQ